MPPSHPTPTPPGRDPGDDSRRGDGARALRLSLLRLLLGLAAVRAAPHRGRAAQGPNESRLSPSRLTATSSVIARWFTERDDDPVPEMGKLVVDPRYRGHHLGTKLAEVRRVLAEEQGLVGRRRGGDQPPRQPARADRARRRRGRAADRRFLGRRRHDRFREPQSGPPNVAPHPIYHRAPPSPGRSTRRRTAPSCSTARRPARLQRSISTEPSEGSARPRSTSGRISGLAHLRVEDGADVIARVADALDGLDAFDLGTGLLDISLSEPSSAATIAMLGSRWASTS